LLKQDAPEDFDVPGVGEYKQPRCPSCGSPDISLYDLDKPYSSLAAGLLLGVTVPVGHKKGQWWQCQVCDQGLASLKSLIVAQKWRLSRYPFTLRQRKIWIYFVLFHFRYPSARSPHRACGPLATANTRQLYFPSRRLDGGRILLLYAECLDRGGRLSQERQSH
jgi:hypothetical protein